MFTEKEKDYINSTQLLHFSTVGADGQPDVVPVRCDFDGNSFYVGGQYMTQSRKYINVNNGNNKVALVIDDLIPSEGDMPAIRGIRVYGIAEEVEREGWQGGTSIQLKITPTLSWSWGIEGPAFTEQGFVTHKTVWNNA